MEQPPLIAFHFFIGCKVSADRPTGTARHLIATHNTEHRPNPNFRSEDLSQCAEKSSAQLWMHIHSSESPRTEDMRMGVAIYHIL
jgi:hypothetical protein